MQWLSSPWWWVLFGFAMTIWHIAYFLRTPARAEAMVQRGDRAGARRLLTRVVNTPSLLGNLLKANALYQLAALEVSEGMYEAALPRLQTLLHIIGGDKGAPGLEYDIRSKLARCLEETGSITEAGAERERAEVALESAPESVPTLIARGQMLEKQFRFAEACAAFERALSLPHYWSPDARAEAFASLGNASYNAGRADQTIHWGEAAIAEEPERPALREMAHVIAGLGYSSQGNLDEAERHRAAALALATAANSEERAGQYRIQLANVALKRGRIAEAFRIAETYLQNPTTTTPALRRDALGVVVECFRSWGRYEDAILHLAQMKTETVYSPDLERRFRGIVSLFMAAMYAERKDIIQARHCLDKAQSKLARDERLGLACRGLAVWVHALEGHWDQSRSIATQVEAQMPTASHDREAHLGCLHFLARAAMVRSEWTVAIPYWKALLGASPDPLTRPAAQFFLAECCRHNGKADEAEQLYRQVVANGLDTYHTKRATDALNTPPAEG